MLKAILLMFALTIAQIYSAATPDESTLTDQHGKKLSLSQLRGKPVLLFFGFTYCPDVCPAFLSSTTRALKADGLMDSVSLVFVSVDPKRDTPRVLAKYVGFFDERIIALSGTYEQVKTLAARFHVRLREGFPSAHTANSFVLDANGHLEAIVPHGFPAAHSVEILKRLLPLTSVTGEYTSFERLVRYDRGVLINFWASWCEPCRRELPALNRLWSELKPLGVQMYAVNVGESKQTVGSFLDDYPIEFPVLIDDQGLSLKRWPIQTLPATLWIPPRAASVLSAETNREMLIHGARDWANFSEQLVE